MKNQNRKAKPASRPPHAANQKSKIETPKSIPLPFMPTEEDALALAKEHNDLFYIIAFMLQCWISGLLHRAATEYAEKKNPKDRSLQTGEAWRTFLEIFHNTLAPANPSSDLRPPPSEAATSACQNLSVSDSRYLLFCCCRFANDDSSFLRRALLPLSIEYYSSDSPISAFQNSSVSASPKNTPTSDPRLPTSDPTSEASISASPKHAPRFTLPTARSSDLLRRWCDWLDSLIHLQTHRRWHLSPACFDPDPEKRFLAALGDAQRNIAKLSPRAQTGWLWDFMTAAQQFQNSPKWTAVGKAMASAPSPTGKGLGEGFSSSRLWQYSDVDTLVIALWPLVTKHNWTYKDLLHVIRSALKRPNAYPCDCDRNFATHCIYVLGLRKPGKSRSAKNGKPKGWELAKKLIGQRSKE
jgi:hypothetical protein